MDYKQLAGERIRSAREALGMSRPQLASMIKGLLPSTLGNYEQGLRYPSPQNLIELSKILNEPPCYLAGIETDKHALAILRAYYQADSRGKQTIHRVAEAEVASYAIAKAIAEEERISTQSPHK